MYAFADDNPISETDPFGLGAVGDSQGYSWIGTPCIQCHGVSAFGYNGNPNSFSAYVPGSAPDAMEGYQGLEDMSVGATKIVGGAMVGNAVVGPAVSAGLSGLAAWLTDTAVTTTTTATTGTLQLSGVAQQTLGATQNGVLLGTVESGQVNLFQAAVGQIESHSQLVTQGLAGQGAQGFSLVVQDGQVTVMRTFSSLNQSTLNYDLPNATVNQLQNILNVPASAILHNP